MKFTKSFIVLVITYHIVFVNAALATTFICTENYWLPSYLQNITGELTQKFTTPICKIINVLLLLALTRKIWRQVIYYPEKRWEQLFI